jgi:H+/Cl- antiporter ClcA
VKAAVPIVALLLIAIGVLGLAYGGFSYFYDDSFDLDPIHTTFEREKKVPITPLAGGIAVGAGVGLLLWSSNKK